MDQTNIEQNTASQPQTDEGSAAKVTQELSEVFLAKQAIDNISGALLGVGIHPAAVAAALVASGGMIIGMTAPKEELDDEFYELNDRKFREAVSAGQAILNDAELQKLAVMAPAGQA